MLRCRFGLWRYFSMDGKTVDDLKNNLPERDGGPIDRSGSWEKVRYAAAFLIFSRRGW